MCDAPAPSVKEAYLALLAEIAREGEALQIEDDRYSRLRGITFLLAAGGLLAALFNRTTNLWIGTAVAWAVFLVFVVLHARVSTRQFDLGRRKQLYDRGLARIAGTYRTDDVHRRGDAHRDEEHPFSSDLDVFGPASLYEQLNVAETPGGAERLAAWLKAPGPIATAKARQRSAQELADELNLRERLAVAGMSAASEVRAVGAATLLLKWAKQPTVMGPLRPVVLLGAVLVIATIGLLTMSAIRDDWGRAWMIPVGLNILLILSVRGRIEPVIGPVVVKQSPLRLYADMMAIVEDHRFEDPALEALRARLAPRDGLRASAALAQLERYTGLASVRHNALALILADVFLLWELFTAERIDGWRGRYGKHLDDWLDALSELEALVCLANFAHEHPGFAWPELSEDGDAHFEGEELGHPLLPPGKRITNDVALDTDTAALMVTGSNMSGKSTMLRSMGVAAVLAQVGAPVCAHGLRLSALEVHTSMRIGDALDRGASRFYMEVYKLKRVVDAARELTPPGSLLFLLDEVLHGTNSRERNIGAKSVVRYLVGQGAIGAVSSHDLGLVELEALTEGRVRNTHFEDHLEEGEMAFDYKMKQGPVGTSNALRLMRSVGIDVPGLED